MTQDYNITLHCEVGPSFPETKIEWDVSSGLVHSKTEDAHVRYLPNSGDFRFVTRASLIVKVKYHTDFSLKRE